MLQLPFADWAAIICAALLIGIGKGGFSGLAMLATPVLALTMPPAEAAAIILPVLIVQDAISVWSFRHDWDRWIVAWMLPGAIAGIALGYLYAANMNPHALTFAIGLVTLGFGAYRLWVERGGRIVAASDSPGWVGTLFGVVSGLTSQISHAGVPPYQIWVAPRKLSHIRFAGTTSILFAMINLIKVPGYIALGVMTPAVLKLSAVLMPVAIISTVIAIRLVRKIDPSRFYRAIFWLMVLVGIKLMTDALAS